MKLARPALLAAVAVAAAALATLAPPSSARGSAAETTAGVVTVTGTGRATLIPDRAAFAFGVVTQAKTAAAALAAGSGATARVIASLRDAGIAKADIQTAEIAISPRTNDRGDAITGYTASNTVTATIRSLDRAGAAIDAAVGVGANEVSGPNLVAADEAAAYGDALRAAAADARAKAETLAAASGVTLGRVTSVSESGATQVLAAEGAAKAAGVPIEPGTQEIDATVTVSFAAG